MFGLFLASGVGVLLGRFVETVFADARDEDADAGREIDGAGLGIGIEIPQRVAKPRHAVSGKRPVGDVVMDLVGRGVVDVLRVVLPVERRASAVELPRLIDDFRKRRHEPPVLTPVDEKTVHHDARHGLHADVALAAGFALNQPREKFNVSQRITSQIGSCGSCAAHSRALYLCARRGKIDARRAWRYTEKDCGADRGSFRARRMEFMWGMNQSELVWKSGYRR